MPEKKSELEREFELERLILFSDAVFAIAITLLVIEIQFPDIEKGTDAMAILMAFKPVIVRFLAFCLSFIFIGVSWIGHLQLCRYLKKYNLGLIRRNLALLFFIVCFPFSASGLTEHIRPGFMLPVFIYIANIVGVMFMQYSLNKYAFYTKPQLSVDGLENDKKYFYLKSKWTAFMLLSALVLYILLSIIFDQQSLLPVLSFYLLPVFLVIMKRRLKKYKPLENKEG